MINRRPFEYLENNELLANVQCGFRKNRATVDHLVRMDTYIMKSFVAGKVTVGVFFNLAKAYDTAWRYGVVKDIYNLGLRCRLSEYVCEFLRDRRFCVAVNWDKSREYVQEAGVPQGSILCVTLFAIKINTLVKVIPPEIHSSLFVDDVQIAYSDYDMRRVLAHLQPTVDRMYVWANTNGFQFSNAKTHCIVFHPKPNYPLKPTLQMNGKFGEVSWTVLGSSTHLEATHQQAEANL